MGRHVAIGGGRAVTTRPVHVAEYVHDVVGDVLPVDLTDDALALEFTRRHRDDLRYVHEWGRWLRWDSTRWAQERKYPQILRWMIEGCLAWQTGGLRPPARVLAATEDYFTASDSIGRWIEERCEIRPDATMAKGAAFAHWKSWAEAGGEHVGTERRLAERLERPPGVDEARTGKARTRTWVGIGLRGEQ